MSAYFIANIRIRDPEEYKKYLKDVDTVFEKFKGEYLALDDGPEVLEGNGDWGRVVLIRFPDKGELMRWYDSEEYRRILQYRLTAADCNAVAIKGK
jgi:uncharacterized protein (DUF1330 family)